MKKNLGVIFAPFLPSPLSLSVCRCSGVLIEASALFSLSLLWVLPCSLSLALGSSVIHFLKLQFCSVLSLSLCAGLFSNSFFEASALFSLSLRWVLVAASLLILFLEWLGGGSVEGFYFCGRARL